MRSLPLTVETQVLPKPNIKCVNKSMIIPAGGKWEDQGNRTLRRCVVSELICFATERRMPLLLLPIQAIELTVTASSPKVSEAAACSLS